jgi:hypothetical protein
MESGDTTAFRLESNQAVSKELEIRVADNANPTRPYWWREDLSIDRFEIEEEFANAVWADPDVVVDVVYQLIGAENRISKAAEYRYTGPWVGGEQRHDLMVVPKVSLRPEQAVMVVPLQDAEDGREVRVTAQYKGKEPLSGTVRLLAPEGWRVSPSEFPVHFAREGEAVTARFQLYSGDEPSPERVLIHAVAEFAGRTFREGYRVIDYDHVRRRHYYFPSEVALQLVDVVIPTDLRVGYIEGVGDEVAEALGELGVRVDFLDSEDLAYGDLNQYDTIMTGVRAYLAREDLRSYNARLLEWVKSGGTLIVQYNKFEFNDGRAGFSPFAPFGAKVGRGRVTDENAAVEVLDPTHPIFSFPNRVGPEDWQGWVQERGLYFLGEKGGQYVDLVSMEDSFEFNAGEKLGSLVYAEVDAGNWVYVGLGLWRQLPAGVPGSYRILANLISLSMASRD